jgi:hypothetical protein
MTASNQIFLVVDAGSPKAAFTTRRELQAYLRRRLDTTACCCSCGRAGDEPLARVRQVGVRSMQAGIDYLAIHRSGGPVDVDGFQDDDRAPAVLEPRVVSSRSRVSWTRIAGPWPPLARQ